MTGRPIKQAFILGAGLGTRMRPLTETIPKPLVPLAGKPLIDHVIDRLIAVGVKHFVINVHYLADKLETHLQTRSDCNIVISDERDQLLDTGGGLRQASDFLQDGPAFIHNSDSVWLEEETTSKSNLARMINAYDENKMQSLLLLANRQKALGYDGKGDFVIKEEGLIKRRETDETCDHVFTGVSIASPTLVKAAKQQPADSPFSLNKLWDKALEQQALFGLQHQGLWMHVGTPHALNEAENCIEQHLQTR